MNQPVITQPIEQTTDTRWHLQRINFPVVGGYLLAGLALVPDIVPHLLPFVPDERQKRIFQTVAVICALVAARFGRTATANAYETLAPAVKELQETVGTTTTPLPRLKDSDG